MAKRPAKNDSPTIENRKARHDYDIRETLEVGIELRGPEVKSIRDGRASIGEGYVRADDRREELWLVGANISEYPPAGQLQHDPVRNRKLLAHKREIRKLLREVSQKGVALVPLRMYFKEGRVKLLIGLGTGRRKSDKRDLIDERETRRDLRRAVSKRV